MKAENPLQIRRNYSMMKEADRLPAKISCIRRNTMNWAEISLKTTTPGIEIVCGFLMAHGVSSTLIEDAADFNSFLTDTTVYWDYVDDDLMKMASCDTVIKFYLADNPQGFETLNQIKADLPSLRSTTDLDLGELKLTVGYKEEEEWETAWKKYYHPIVISEKLAIVPEWESFAPSGRGRGQSSPIRARWPAFR